VFAENFDGVGLTRDITVNLGVAMRGKRVLLLGAGGAARGALLPFLAEEPAELVLVNRTLSKAAELGAQFAGAGKLVVCGYAELADISEQFDLVINATSASLRNELPPVPANAFRGAPLAYELAYGKGLTPFLQAARAAGVPNLADGVGMLVEQAAEAFTWWRGVRPQTAPLIAQMTVPLI
jgi:shikimate dehydrogenase